MYSRSSNLFLVCIILIIFSGVLQAIAEEPVLIMAEVPVPIMVEQLAVGEAAGAEDVAIDAQGRIYGGMADGRIIRYQPDGSQPEVLANTEGRPLGLAFDVDGNLIVADANKGLLSVSPDGAITILSTEYDGVPYGLPNDVDVAEDGTIYFSDSSFKISLADALTELQEAPGPYGRLLKYDPETQTTELVLGDLWFANGVAVSPDQSFVLIVEMAENRIARYWLTGPEAGQSDIFVENLPVWPDGVSSNGQDTFWVAVLGEGLILGLDLDGNIVHTVHPLYRSGAPYGAVASAEEHEDMLYLGHLEDDFIPRLAIMSITITEEELLAVHEASYEALNAHDVDGVMSYWTDDTVYDFVPTPPPMNGKEEVAAFIGELYQKYPDFHVTQSRILVSGNIMVTESTVTGTHSATGKSIQSIVMHIFEFEEDKVKRVTEYLDIVGFMVQLGLMPASELPPLEPSFILPDTEPTRLASLEAAAELGARWSSHDLESYAKMIQPDADIMNAALGVPTNRDAFIVLQEFYFQAFSDVREEIVRSIDLGDGWVVVETVYTGTHDGSYFGVPATGRSMTLRAGILYRFDADGLLTNLYSYFDNMTILAQIGALEPAPDTEANKAIARRVFEEVMNQKKLDLIDEIYATDYIYHPSEIRGSEGIKQYYATLLTAFPDAQWTVEDIFAEGDKVAIRWTTIGTQQGEFRGMPPTGKQVTLTAIVIYRFADGKIVEGWNNSDQLGLLEQLGVAPPTHEDFSWGVPSEVTGEPGNPEENKAVVMRSTEEFWNQKNLDVLNELSSADVVAHNPVNLVNPIRGIEAYKQSSAMYFTAFPDLHVTIDDMFAEGDKVVQRWTVTATHKGELMGVPPTGKQITWSGITISRFADGKSVEDWWAYDMLGMMQQLGVIPSMMPKDYSNVFFMPLTPGLNMVSLPLESQTPYTARSFAEKLSATAVITLDEARQKFMGFTLDAPDDGFQIEGGKGYIVNVPEGGMVAFTGAAWTRPPMPAPEVRDFGYPAQTDGAWAFVVSGRFVDDSADSLKKDGYLVTVRNTRTNAVTTDVVRSRYFAAAFADLNRKNVVQTGDRLELQLRNQAGEIVSDSLHYTVTSDAIRQAFMPLTLKNVEIPRQSLLLPNYPNPFNPETWIPYQIRESADVMIRIYNAKGQLVRTLDLGQRAAGFYLGHTRAAHWDGHNDAGEKVASGIYFYQLQAGDFSATRRMLVLK